MAIDLVVSGGTIYDGTGSPGVVGDVLISGDRIVEVGSAPAESAAQVIDATGLAVVPGFINGLSHAWGSLQQDGSGASDLLQGVTTEVFGEAYSLGPGNDDVERLAKRTFGEDPQVTLSFGRLNEGLDHMVSLGVAPNVTSFVGGHNLRVLAAGYDDRRLTAAELDRVRGVLAEEMQDGALGLGTALIYPPGTFADTAELIELSTVVGEYGGTYISHMRSEGDQFLECLDELLDIGLKADCRTAVYHLKAAGRHNWHKMRQAIDRIEMARQLGQPVTANMYPYCAGGTALAASIPPHFHVGGPDALRARLDDPEQRALMAAALRERSNEFENLFIAAGPEGILFGADLDDGTPAAGQRLSEVAAGLGIADPAEALVELVRRSPNSSVMYFIADEANVELGLSQPWVSLGSDAEAVNLSNPQHQVSMHPRTFGTFGRFLGTYVRDRQVTTFTDAIRRMTSLPADAFGLGARGRLKKHYFADLAVLDPAAVGDTATYEKPSSYAVGVRDVIVNGQVAVRDGELTGARPGRRIGLGR